MKNFSYNRTVPYSREQMFDLIQDVERYPQFLPGWRRSRVLERGGDRFTVEQVLTWGAMRVRFRSRIRYARPERIDITTAEDPFRHLSIHWRFDATALGCVIRLQIDSELRSATLDRIMEPVVKSRFSGIVSAFEERASLVYPGIHTLSECSRPSSAASLH